MASVRSAHAREVQVDHKAGGCSASNCSSFCRKVGIAAGGLLLMILITGAILLGVYLRKSSDTDVPTIGFVAKVEGTTPFLARPDQPTTLTTAVPKTCAEPCGVTLRYTVAYGSADVTVYVGSFSHEAQNFHLAKGEILEFTLDEANSDFTGACTRAQINNGKCNIYSVFTTTVSLASGVVAINSTAAPEATPSPTPKITRTPTSTSTQTPTNTRTSTPSLTAGLSPSETAFPTETKTATRTGTQPATVTPTISFSKTNTPSFTKTPSNTASQTDTRTGSQTRSPTSTGTHTRSPTVTKSASGTPEPTKGPPGDVTTLAGQVTSGSADGTGTNAQFNGPRGIAIDNTDAFMYIADTYNHLIRKLVLSSGAVTVFAGSSQGFTDATGTDAQFFLPHGLCVDSSGNIFVVEEGNNAIRKITSGRVVTTFAGQSTSGSDDGTGTDAKFYAPYGITINRANGDMFVADTANNLIRKVTSAGVVTTYAGDGSQGSSDATGTSASFFTPYAVTVDTSGIVFVADYSNYVIRKIDTSRVVTTYVGSTDGYVDDTGTDAQFMSPTGLVINGAGLMYVADYVNNVVRSVSASRVVTTYVGLYAGDADGTGTDALFRNPFALAISSTGKTYMVDIGNNKIKSIN